jgi:hypothetical protein
VIDRSRFLLTSLAGPVAAPLAAEAQPGTPPRIALVLPAVPLGEYDPDPTAAAGPRQCLAAS